MRRLVHLSTLAASVAVFTTACASKWQPLDRGDISGDQAKSVLLVVAEAESFTAPPQGFSALIMGGMAGAEAWHVAGDQLVQANALADPSERLGAEIAKSFGERHHLNVASVWEARPRPPYHRPPPRPTADLILEVHTTRWGLEPGTYGAKAKAVYAVRLEVSVSLRDGATRKTYAQGTCRGDLGKGEIESSYESLVADGATRVKSELTLMTDQCIAKLSSELLRAPANGPAPASPPSGNVAGADGEERISAAVASSPRALLACRGLWSSPRTPLPSSLSGLVHNSGSIARA